MTYKSSTGGREDELIGATNAEDASREAERHSRLVLDSIPGLVALLTPDGSVEFGNRQILEYTGRTMEELKNWGTSDVVHAEDLPHVRRIFEQSIHSGSPYEIEQRLRRADGVYRWFQNKGFPLHDTSGHIVRWCVLFTDIDERRCAENQLRESERESRLIVDTIPALVWCNLPDGSNEFLNKQWQDYTGLSQQEASGWGWKVAFHADDLRPLLEKWSACLASGEANEIEARLRRHDGAYRWFLIRVEPLRDERGNIHRWYGTSSDIDDLKRAHIELRHITDAIEVVIVVQSPEGLPLYTNRVASDYMGFSVEDVGAQNWRARVLHPDDIERLREERHAALQRPVPFILEERVRRWDGAYRWFLIRYTPLLDVNGEIIRWYLTGTDIDDRKRREERTQKEVLALREEIDASSMFEEVVGDSAAFHTVLRRVAKVAPTDSTVLISGETGTGKELIARAIHKRSPRSERAFVSVNCAAIPEALVASELFGHEKGAFTGAVARRLGRFELADGGTLFLDEVGELPAETQVALLRVLQEREFERVGGNRPIHSDVRVVAATNRDLPEAIRAGTFRDDLFYRLNVFPIVIPPLRERRSDIALLVQYFVERYATKAGKKIDTIDQKSMNLLQSYPWPGNIRELQNVIERSMIVCDTERFSVDESWLAREASATRSPRSQRAEKLAAQADEKATIEAALAQSKGRVSGERGAAAKLRLPVSTVETKIRSLGINKHRFKII